MADVLAGAAGEAYSHWTQTFDATASAFSTGNVKPNTANSRSWAKELRLTIDRGAIRFTYDGTTPSTTLGHSFSTGDQPLVLQGPVNIQGFQGISLAGGAGAVAPQVRVTAIRDQKLVG